MFTMKSSSVSSLVTLLVTVSTAVSQSDYCSFTSKHTMCQYQGPGPACNGKPLTRGVTEKEKEIILDIHNKLRAKIAQGAEKRGSPGPQPGASNMKKMIWDEELSRIAQRHADQCKFAHDCSDCRKTSRFGVGQNLYIYKQTLKAANNDWVKAVTDWYDEVALFRNKDVEPFSFSLETGHYTQVIWSETDKVGCGATSYKDGQWYATLYTCNYGPNGNFIRGQMYKQGPPCSSCGQGETCSAQYPGLCETSGSNQTPVKPSIPPAPRKQSVQPKKQPVQPKIQPSKATQAPFRNKQVTPKADVPKPTTQASVPRTTSRTTTRRTTERRRTTPRRVVTTSKPKTVIITNNDLETNIKTINDGEVLFKCDFNPQEKKCVMKDRGKPWDTTGRSNKYKKVKLSRKDTAEFYFKQLIAPPTSNLACLDFRFKKFASDGSDNTLTVLAWPYRGKPGKVTIQQDSPDLNTWVRAQVTFKNVDRDFLLMFRARGPRSTSADLTLAVDNVLVTAGRCVEE